MTILQLYIHFSCVFDSIFNAETNTTDSIHVNFIFVWPSIIN